MTNPSPPTILVVDDEPDINEIVVTTLQDEGFVVHSALDGEEGLRRAQELLPSLIIMDVNMPKLNGMEVCRRLRADPATQAIPIIMLTANQDEDGVVLGLGIGANDYMSKPFRRNELIARIQAQLRQAAPASSAHPTITAGAVQMDLSRHEVHFQGKPVELTVKEFRLLWALGSHPGEVLSREQLLREISDPGEDLLGRNIDVHVNTIRKKFGRDAHVIVSVRGLGYKLVA